ncbi:transposase [Burkholderia sp. Ac-20365]|uniref:transposase n=1 Tax=Burkholderia sp. Ac-20365 TaxID=2703897 RepID=UPI00197BCA6B|nr:transposase [Burkholderia sp. Ac-20365]MBN3767735.1 transposase [Burkholderia sp. Ac-20365]
MTPYRDITDDEWQRVAPLLPELRPRSELRGRPLANTRSVLNGVLWVIYSGATWSAMPRKYPSYQTCHRRFKAWHQAGVLKRVMDQLFGDAGNELCNTMEARMRTHAPNALAAANDAAHPQPSMPALPIFTPPSSVPVAPLVFDYTSPFKNAA